MDHRLLLLATTSVWAIALGTVGCGREGGLARIELTLPESLPNETFEVRIRVEERADEKKPGPIVSSAPAFSLAPGQSEVKLPRLEIPNGDRRVAIVELARPGAERVLYYGVSKPFSLGAGEEVVVPVLIGFVEPPEGMVRIATDRAGFVRSPEVELRLAIDTAEDVRISNHLSFPDDASMTLSVGELTAAEGGEHSLPWSLDAGLDLPCGDSDYCLRQVFVRFVDQFGYEAPTKTSTIVVDTRPPSVRDTPAVSVTFEPSWDARRTLARAGAGTFVRVTFALSEPTYASPVVSAVGPVRIDFETCEGTTLIYCSLQIDPADPAPEGTYAIEAAAEDLAGNRASLTVASFVVDMTPPSAPETSTTDRVIYRRTPWGSDATGGESRFSVEGGVAAIEPGSTVLVLDHPTYEDPNTQVIGSSGRPAPPDGTFAEIELARADRERVYVVAVDDAGNRSEARLVEQVRWLATAGSGAPRSDLNPHAVDRVPRFGQHVLVQDSRTIFATTATDAAQLSRRDDLKFASHGRSVWSERNRLGDLALARARHAMAFDRARGRLVVFGGSDGLVPYSAETREWDGDRWVRPVLFSAEPEPRVDAAMVYHGAIGRALMFGGAGAIFFGDTWTYDGRSWQEVPGPNAPSARSKSAMAYDSLRGRTVLFGGNNPDDLLPFDDTWEFDGARWEQVPIQGPSPRRDSAMAFDVRRGRVVLFGGVDQSSKSPVELNDTWEYDGSTWSFVPAGTSTAPPARGFHAMAYDEERGSVVLFGGAQYFSGALDDAWEWVVENGQMQWRRIGGSLPSARSDHTMVYAPAAERVLVLGGRDPLANSVLDDLWFLDRAGSLEATPLADAPPPRTEAAAAYDPVTKSTIVFGGFSATQELLADTWRWDGWRWQEVESPGPYLLFPSLAEHDGSLTLFGTDPDTLGVQVWRWSGFDWTPLLSASGVEPTPRIDLAIGRDPTSNELLLYGGSIPDPDGNLIPVTDMFGWTGTEWHQVQPTTIPPGRFGHAMVTDGARRLVMAGGVASDGTPFDDLWEWDGATADWIGPSSPSAVFGPPPRFGHAMTYDRSRARVVLSGGLADFIFGDLWEWSGADDRWEMIETAGAAPSARTAHALVYDPERERLVLFDGSSALADTWELSRDPSERPAIQLAFAVSDAPITRDAVDEIRAVIVAGGRGYATVPGGTGAAQDGAVVLAWDAYAGAWIELASTFAPPEQLGEITFSTSSAEEARRLIAADGFVHLAIVPASGAGNGPRSAEVEVDVAELQVSYRQN